jgi:hypothetical protein
MGTGLKKGNFAELDMSKNNSEESDGGEQETANKNEFSFANQNKKQIGGGSFQSKLKAPSF